MLGEAGSQYLGTLWWEDKFEYVLRNKPAAAEFLQLLQAEMTDLQSGARECLAGLSPSPPVAFDTNNPDHIIWLLSDLDGEQVTGGRLQVRIENDTPRSDVPPPLTTAVY